MPAVGPAQQTGEEEVAVVLREPADRVHVAGRKQLAVDVLGIEARQLPERESLGIDARLDRGELRRGAHPAVIRRNGGSGQGLDRLLLLVPGHLLGNRLDAELQGAARRRMNLKVQRHDEIAHPPDDRVVVVELDRALSDELAHA